MNKYRIFLSSLLIIIMFSTSSCHDKLFDFNIDNIDADGNWGIPILNGTIGIDQLLNNTDSMHYVQTDENGVFKLVFEGDAENLVHMSNIFNIDNRTFDTTGVYMIDELPTFHIDQVLPFNLSTEDVILKEAVIKSGIMTLYFNITSANFAYTATLTSQNITDANDTPLSMTFSNTQHQQTLNLSNYTVQPDFTGIIYLSANITVNTTSQVNQITYECHNQFTNCALHSITGQLRAIEIPINSAFGFSLPLNNFHFNNISFNNAKLSLSEKNSLCAINGTINEFTLFGNQPPVAPLITNPITINLPLSPNQYTQAAEVNLLPIHINQNLDSIRMNSNFIVNPDGFAAGDIYVDENSSLSLRVKTEFPTNLSIDNAVYRDTIDNDLHKTFNFGTIQSIDLLTLRFAITNLFPFDLTPSIDFLNSQTGEIFHVNLNNMHIHGAYNNTPIESAPAYIDFNHDDAKKILNSDKVILTFRIDTNGNDVEINNTQNVRIALGAKISYSQISL